MDCGTSVKVAVRIRPLSSEDSDDDGTLCINTVPGVPQIIAGADSFFTFDHVFGVDSTQSEIYNDCVVELVDAAFEGFNATILAYGQTGSGKTWTMGSGEQQRGSSSFGIIPRVIQNLFEQIQQREGDDPNSTYKVQVQFLEIYGEDIRDLLDHNKISKVTIRESSDGEVFVSGAKEEAVGSAPQMMKTLEDGTRHRTTASTLMNQSSSRSHGTNNLNSPHKDSDPLSLDHHSEPEQDTQRYNNEENVTHSKEVRRCKFHFVDLAGSERAKRTGAQGQQMKEGIDINKGLLALGNVISALGDEQKKGKVHVPYRVSKLTRMLQDSLGGNSKTLMICCVSPSGVNFYESLNALRYANRARNIKNKPVVNRDPTLVMIDELKQLIKVLALELVDVRKKGYSAPEGSLPLQDLEMLLLNGSVFRSRLLQLSNTPQPQRGNKTGGLLPRAGNGAVNGDSTNEMNVISHKPGSSNSSSSNVPHNGSNYINNGSNSITPRIKADREADSARERERDMHRLKSRATDADFEMKRLTEQLKRAKLEASQMSERVILIQSERDFYKMKWSESSPLDALNLNSVENRAVSSETSSSEEGKGGMYEKKMVTSISAEYLREIEGLRRQLAESQQLVATNSSVQLYDTREAMLENELTSNVARVIAQTEKHLLLEAKRLKSIGLLVDGVGKADDENEDSEDDNSNELNIIGSEERTGKAHGDRGLESQIEEEDQSYQRRQKMMTEEVAELGESIELKEQLLGQLRKSHYQYGVMKAFYEQKLTALNGEMDDNQVERERLLSELEQLEHNSNRHEEKAIKHQNDQQKRLLTQLQKKDEELRLLKKRQEELSGLSRIQSRYMAQVTRLEVDIDGMRKQKVDLSKSLQQEKKKHFVLLNEKAREIDKLKRSLMISESEAKRLEKDKLKAEQRTKEAIKDSAAMRKKVNESQRYGGAADSASAKARLARRAMGGVGKSSTPRILSEEELRTKKWLDKRIADINAREEAADTLRKQCEQQLALLNKKAALELERATMENCLRDVVTGFGSVEVEDRGPLSKEEEEALQEIQDRLECVEGQLKLRDRNISEIESRLAGSEGISSAQESTVEALKRTAAVSLPAAHELIRLLFDMLVTTKSAAQQRKASLMRSEGREKQLRYDLDDSSTRMNALVRAHDMELTRSANEYEEKLCGLFTHSSIGKMVIAESGFYKDDPGVSDSASVSESASANYTPLTPTKLAIMSTSPQSPSSSVGRYRSSAEASYKMLLSVATEQSNLLRSRLERESGRGIELQSRISEMDHSCMSLQRELEEKDVHIRFLEDERALFRDMADSLRAGISALGGSAGQTILKQIKDRISDAGDDSDDEETESVLGEFSNLSEMISRTGNVISTSEKTLPSSGPGGAISPINTLTTSASAGSLGIGKQVVYDRLTNPNNFTGAMKNAFGQDLAKKKLKVQQIKSGLPTKKEGRDASPFVFVNSRTHNKEHMAAYLDGSTSSNTSGEFDPKHISPDSLPVPPLPLHLNTRTSTTKSLKGGVSPRNPIRTVSQRLRSSTDSSTITSGPSLTLATSVKSPQGPSYSSHPTQREKERVKNTVRPPVPEWRDSSIFDETEPIMESVENPHSNSKRLSLQRSMSPDNLEPPKAFYAEVDDVMERENASGEANADAAESLVEACYGEEEEIDDSLPDVIPAPSRLSNIGGIIRNLFSKNTSLGSSDVEKRQAEAEEASFISIAGSSGWSALEGDMMITENSHAEHADNVLAAALGSTAEEENEGGKSSQILCNVDSSDEEASLSLASDDGGGPSLSQRNSLDNIDMLSMTSRRQKKIRSSDSSQEKAISHEERHIEKLKNRLKSATSKTMSPTATGGGMRPNSAFNSSRIK